MPEAPRFQPRELFGRDKALVGMVHLAALPGTPRASLSAESIANQAVHEARVLREAGFDAVIFENMHDAPYVWGGLGPEITATMTRAVIEGAASFGGPTGVQVLSGGHLEALAIAAATGSRFIRCENFVFAHVADEGIAGKAVAGELLRERRRTGAEGVAVLADLKKKHASHALTGDISLIEAAEAAVFFGADGLIVTGTATGKPAKVSDVAEVRGACGLPVLVGSGVTPESAPALLEHADALIVGSWYKRGGHWAQGPDPARAEALAKAVAAAR